MQHDNEHDHDHAITSATGVYLAKPAIPHHDIIVRVILAQVCHPCACDIMIMTSIHHDFIVCASLAMLIFSVSFLSLKDAPRRESSTS